MIFQRRLNSPLSQDRRCIGSSCHHGAGDADAVVPGSSSLAVLVAGWCSLVAAVNAVGGIYVCRWWRL